jgi:hypothetical protein
MYYSQQNLMLKDVSVISSMFQILPLTSAMQIFSTRVEVSYNYFEFDAFKRYNIEQKISDTEFHQDIPELEEVFLRLTN